MNPMSWCNTGEGEKEGARAEQMQDEQMRGRRKAAAEIEMVICLQWRYNELMSFNLLCWKAQMHAKA